MRSREEGSALTKVHQNHSSVDNPFVAKNYDLYFHGSKSGLTFETYKVAIIYI